MASPLKLLAFTDRSAYCPRERMKLTTDIKNLPLTQTYQTTIFLVQTISFKSRCGKSRTDRCQQKMIQRSSLSWAVDDLEVPDVPPTMRNCGILSITYHVKVDIRLTRDWLTSLTEGTRDGRTAIDKLYDVSSLDWTFTILNTERRRFPFLLPGFHLTCSPLQGDKLRAYFCQCSRWYHFCWHLIRYIWSAILDPPYRIGYLERKLMQKQARMLKQCTNSWITTIWWRNIFGPIYMTFALPWQLQNR